MRSSLAFKDKSVLNLTLYELLLLPMHLHRALSYPHSRSFLSFQTNFEFTAHGTLKSPYPLRRRQHREESRAEAPIGCGGDVERRVDVEEIMGLEENIQVLVGHPTGTR